MGFEGGYSGMDSLLINQGPSYGGFGGSDLPFLEKDSSILGKETLYPDTFSGIGGFEGRVMGHEGDMPDLKGGFMGLSEDLIRSDPFSNSGFGDFGGTSNIKGPLEGFSSKMPGFRAESEYLEKLQRERLGAKLEVNLTDQLNSVNTRELGGYYNGGGGEVLRDQSAIFSQDSENMQSLLGNSTSAIPMNNFSLPGTMDQFSMNGT